MYVCGRGVMLREKKGKRVTFVLQYQDWVVQLVSCVTCTTKREKKIVTITFTFTS